MFRSIAVAALFAVAASAAHAADASKADAHLILPYNAHALGTEAGRETLKRQATEEIEAYCRAHPVEGTVAGCRASLTADANRQIEDNARAYAARQGGVKLTNLKRRSPIRR